MEKTAIGPETDALEAGEYAEYPEAFEKLLNELTFPTEDAFMKKFYLSMTVSSLLHY